MSLIFSKLIERVSTKGPKINGCIHIGAHWGQEYQDYKTLGIENLIFYEPIKANFDILKQNVGLEVDLRNVALGNTSGFINMNVETKNYGQSSSVLEPKLHLNQYPNIEFLFLEEVPINKLDEEPFIRENFNFLNVDVQGYELEVFKGASKTLENIDYIISEINAIEMYKDCVMVGDLDNFLSLFGFIRGFTEWHQDIETWGNAIYWKENE